LDGVRAFKYNGVLMSRSFKAIPNNAVQQKFAHVPEGYDGELIVGNPTASDCYRRTVSTVMSYDAEATEVIYDVFDRFDLSAGFATRLNAIDDSIPGILVVPHALVENPEELLAVETEMVKQGYEGLILRDPRGRYKQGRSTLREGIMLKLKRFQDAEATIIDFQELLRNKNPAFKDAQGYTDHTSHQAHMVPAGTLGALVVMDGPGRQFNIGTGFDDSLRAHIWNNRTHYIGKLVKYKFLAVGMKDLPRHPVFLGFRHEADL
jgi:DNA ligase-1